MGKKKIDEVTFAVFKGDRDVEANKIKTNAMAVIISFVGKIRDIEVLDDANSVIIRMPDEPGDVKWCMDNVFRYVDPIGANNPAEIERRAEKFCERAHSVPDFDPKKVGAGIIEKHLNDYYLIQKHASIFRRKENGGEN